MSYHKIICKLSKNAADPEVVIAAALAAAKINIKGIQLVHDAFPDLKAPSVYAVTFEYQFKQDQKYNWATHTCMILQGSKSFDAAELSGIVYDWVIDIRALIEANDPGVYNYMFAPDDLPFEVDTSDKIDQLYQCNY